MKRKPPTFGTLPCLNMFLHANLEIFGVQGYGVLVDRSIRLCRYMAEKVRSLPFAELVVDPMSNILLYRFVPRDLVDLVKQRQLDDSTASRVDEWNVRLQTQQKAAGLTFVSRTTIYSPRHNRRVVALRVVIANPLTTESDIDQTLHDQLKILTKWASADE